MQALWSFTAGKVAMWSFTAGKVAMWSFTAGKVAMLSVVISMPFGHGTIFRVLLSR